MGRGFQQVGNSGRWQGVEHAPDTHKGTTFQSRTELVEMILYLGALFLRIEHGFSLTALKVHYNPEVIKYG